MGTEGWEALRGVCQLTEELGEVRSGRRLGQVTHDPHSPWVRWQAVVPGTGGAGASSATVKLGGGGGGPGCILQGTGWNCSGLGERVEPSLDEAKITPQLLR